ncbi:hypothetical protein Aperf_G00000038843 [Anoplocephala perfoliata]
MLSVLLNLFSYFLAVSAQNMGCRDETNRIVDWLIAYKYPNGFSYGLVTSAHTNWSMTGSDLRFTGFLKHNFDQVLDNTKKNIVFGMYNDEVPPNTTSRGDVWYGHMKGLFAFPENEQGFWLIHSVPKLSMKPNEFVYPNTSEEYAQHFFCVTLNYSDLETIADHLVISRPLIQNFQLPDSIEKNIPKLGDVFHHRVENNASQSLSTFLTSSGDGISLRQFTKSRKFCQDLYSDLVAPALEVSLYAETWRHTSSNLPSNCSAKFWVKNIEKLKWPDPMKIHFKSTADHAKWAVSIDEKGDKWTCFGDINRSESQFTRGGGTLCVKETRIWKLFHDLVAQVEGCPTFIPWTKLSPSLPLN